VISVVGRPTSKGENETDVANRDTRTQDTVAMSRDRQAAAARHVVQRWRFATEELTSSGQSKQVNLCLFTEVVKSL